MNQKEHDKILAFDTLFTNNHIQMLKILMPLFDVSVQRHIAVYIKYLELQYTITFSKRHSFPFFPKSADTHSVCREILPYCSAPEKQKVQQMEQLFASIQNYREMMDMVSMMKDMFPEGDGGFSPDMLSGLFGGDASQMFEMFQNFNSAGQNSSGSETT